MLVKAGRNSHRYLRIGPMPKFLTNAGTNHRRRGGCEPVRGAAANSHAGGRHRLWDRGRGRSRDRESLLAAAADRRWLGGTSLIARTHSPRLPDRQGGVAVVLWQSPLIDWRRGSVAK